MILIATAVPGMLTGRTVSKCIEVLQGADTVSTNIAGESPENRIWPGPEMAPRLCPGAVVPVGGLLK